MRVEGKAERTMGLKAISTAKKIALGVVAGLLAACLCFALGVLWKGRSGEARITSDVLTNSIQQAQELTTVKYIYTNMGKFEESTDFYGWKVPFTKKAFIISYDGEIMAGVDLSRASVRRQGAKITVALPQAKILSHAVKEDSVQVFDETSNVFNPIRITDYTEFSQDQKAALEQKAVNSGILQEARTRAEESIRSMLTSLQGDESWEITFENAE